MVLALFLACGGRGSEPTARPGGIPAGPDPVAVRVPMAGGVARAVAFGNPDSAIWRATQASPGVERLLGLDTENGFLAFVDTAGQPGWIDLRLGATRRPTKGQYSGLASADGWSIYGVSGERIVQRFTPGGDWESRQPVPVERVIPLPDGALLVVLRRPDGTTVLSMRPPDDSLADSVSLPKITHVAVTSVGDRTYLSTSEELIGVSSQALDRLQRYDADGEVVAIAPTPSGDRVFLAFRGNERLRRLDRYGDEVHGSVSLPGPVSELRIDPYGRYLLARPEQGDSVWVVSVASEVLIGTVKTAWRSDFPTVAVDGTVGTVAGADVVFVRAETTEEVRRVPGGAADLWYLLRWNGFRPRARGIDQPVSFRVSAATDSGVESRPVVFPTRPAAPPATDSTAPSATPPAPVPPPAPVSRSRWMVSFAAVLSLERAREIAAGISVGGQRPRVVTSEADGTPVFRVVLGPFETRAEADRAGRSAGHSYWVFEGGSP